MKYFPISKYNNNNSVSLRKDHGGERIVWTPRSIVETLSHIMSYDSIYISTSENGGVYPPLTRNRTNYPNKPRPAWIGAGIQTTHDTLYWITYYHYPTIHARRSYT